MKWFAAMLVVLVGCSQPAEPVVTKPMKWQGVLCVRNDDQVSATDSAAVVTIDGSSGQLSTFGQLSDIFSVYNWQTNGRTYYGHLAGGGNEAFIAEVSNDGSKMSASMRQSKTTVLYFEGLRLY